VFANVEPPELAAFELDTKGERGGEGRGRGDRDGRWALGDDGRAGTPRRDIALLPGLRAVGGARLLPAG